jgi:hypothetical protein
VYEVIDLQDPEPVRTIILESIFSEGDTMGLNAVLSGIMDRIGDFDLSDFSGELEGILTQEGLSVNTEDLIHTLSDRLRSNFPDFIGKAIFYTLTASDLLLNPQDVDGTADFSELAEEVKAKINKSLPEYVSAHVSMELESVLSELRQELPQPIRVRALPHREPQQQPQPINVTVNPPNITIAAPTLPAPVAQKEEEMQVIINNPQSVEVSDKHAMEAMKSMAEDVTNVLKQSLSPIINVPAPVVNVTTPEVTVNVPENPTNVQITTPAPVVNVDVNPTPVTVENTVVLPEQKPANKTITIVKDGNVWHGESKTEE